MGKDTERRFERGRNDVGVVDMPVEIASGHESTERERRLAFMSLGLPVPGQPAKCLFGSLDPGPRLRARPLDHDDGDPELTCRNQL